MKALCLPSHLRKLYKHWRILQAVENQYLLEDWLGCIANCSKLIESLETDFFGYYYRGLCHVKLKFFEEAISDFETSKVNLAKNRFPTLMKEFKQDVELRIANVFRLERKYGLALNKLNLLIEEYPDYVSAYKEKAGIYADMDDSKSALDAVNHGLKHRPRDQELQEFRKLLIYNLTAN